jgi:hypothetical protein
MLGSLVIKTLPSGSNTALVEQQPAYWENMALGVAVNVPVEGS